MALNIGNKVYRNLQEQVGYNSEQIDKIFSILDGIDYEDHVVVIENISIPLTEEEMAIVNEPVAFLVYQDRLYFKDSSDSENIYFSAVIDVRGTDIVTIQKFQISVNSSGGMEAISESSNVYSSNEIDEKVTSLENLISGLASGSPKGVYATLADLQTAYPTGTTGIYLVSADGHWYYWNGSIWADGGLYLSSGEDVQKLQNQMAFVLTDNSFIYDEDFTVVGDSTYVYENHDFPVNFSEETKVTLHVDNIVGNTTVDCVYLYALDATDTAISYIAIYWGTRDTVELNCPTITKKIRVQFYPASGTAMPSGFATFSGVTCYIGNRARYIDADKIYPNILHVGAGYKYTTIQSAVDDASDGDTILIHDGTYNESVKVYGSTQNIHTSAKNIRLIGTNRDSCIITHSISDYTNPPLEIAMGYVENLTIIGTGTTTDTQFAYCLHMDFGTSMYKNVQFNNCRFVNTKYPCVGTGIREGQKEYFLNCVFECDDASAFLFHEDQTNNVTNASICFDGCAFISNSSYDATIHVQETASFTGNDYKVTFRKCIVKHLNGGLLVRLYELNGDPISGNGWLNSNIYNLTIDSDLNSDNIFNY